MKSGYTHPNGKGAGKYNGMVRAADWIGRRVLSTRQIVNNGGDSCPAGTPGKVRSVSRGLSVHFQKCPHCGTSLYVRQLGYDAIELDEPHPPRKHQ